MIYTYFKIAFRHLWKRRLYACINIAGLAAGITCVLLAVLFISDEQSFDDFHTNNPNLFRVTTTVTDGKREPKGVTGQVQGPVFKAEIPEVVNFSRIMGGDIYGDIRDGNNALRLQMLFVDHSFADIFSFKFTSGNRLDIFPEVNSVVVTEKTALRFFKRTDVIGKTLQMDADPSARRIGKPLVISGVIENPPLNSSIQFDVLFPFEFLQLSFDDKSWTSNYLGTFLQLRPDANLTLVSRKMNELFRIHAKQQLRQNEAGQNIIYGLQAITDVHLNPNEISASNREGGIVNESKPVYSYLFLGISGFILLMASINFVNISISNSLKRAKEIGIKKVTGSTQGQITLQFLGEAVFVCLIAFSPALLVTVMVLPFFNQITGKQISAGVIFNGKMLFWFLCIFVFNMLAAGLYPALVLSRFNPVEVLYARNEKRGKRYLRSSLVVFQFSVALFLGIASLIFYQQMRLLRTKDLGYDPEQIVVLKIPSVDGSEFMGNNFKNELSLYPTVGMASFTGSFGYRDATANDKVIHAYHRTIDADYLPMMQMKILEGRNFFDGDAYEKNEVLVNEAFLTAAGLKNAVDVPIYVDSNFGKKPFRIIGVVRDFHFLSLRERIQPMIMLNSGRFGGDAMLAKIGIDKQKEALSILEKTFRKLLYGAVFEYNFLSEQNAKEYEQELRWQKIVGFTTLLSIMICCIGLFGLAHLSVTHRTRETAIRVIMGATIANIVFLFSRDFVKMVLIAILIAGPGAWYVMDIWLSSFAYHITIPWWIFFVAFGLALIITLVTVSVQAVRAGMMSPVKAFRNAGG